MCDVLNNLIVGTVSGCVSAILISFIQYFFSKSRSLVRSVTKATREYFELQHNYERVAGLRNKHRHHLGVYLDEFIKSFGTGLDFREEGPWPMVIDFKENKPDEFLKSTDRWSRYDKYARPIQENLDPLIWLTIFPFFTNFKRLKSLLDSLASVVEEIDSIISKKIICQTDKNEIGISPGNDPCALREKFRSLHKCWEDWHTSCN